MVTVSPGKGELRYPSWDRPQEIFGSEFGGQKVQYQNAIWY